MLAKRLLVLGFGNVLPLGSSGNFILETTEPDSNIVRMLIRKALHFDAEIVLRTPAHIHDIIGRNPFGGKPNPNGLKWAVSFLSDEAPGNLVLPAYWPSRDSWEVERFRVDRLEAFSLWRRKDGAFGRPNKFVEEQLRVKATTRSWRTVQGLARRLNSDD